MTAKNAKFKADLNRFARKVELDMDLIVRKVALDLLSAIVKRTPVDTGALRGSWLVQQDVTPQQPDTTDKRGSSTVARGQVELARFKAGEHVYILTHLPYAIEIEHGYSKQAPSGMVKITVAEFRQYLERQASMLKAV